MSNHRVHGTLSVRLRPRGGRDALDGWRDGVLQARVAAPAVGGQANRALIRLVAGALGVAPSRVTLLRGERARQKVLRVEGLDAVGVLERLGRCMPGEGLEPPCP